jgi:hypothetical protein
MSKNHFFWLETLTSVAAERFQKIRKCFRIMLKWLGNVSVFWIRLGNVSVSFPSHIPSVSVSKMGNGISPLFLDISGNLITGFDNPSTEFLFLLLTMI